MCFTQTVDECCFVFLVQMVQELIEQQQFQMENVCEIFQLFNTKYLQTVRKYGLCSVRGLLLCHGNVKLGVSLNIAMATEQIEQSHTCN